MMDIEDMLEILAIDLIGVVPEDQYIVISTNRGEPAILDKHSRAGQAYRNISRRLLGEEIPFINWESGGFMSRIKKLMGLG